MKENLEKYANLLLKRCLNLKEGESLFISAPIENYDFVKIINKKALDIGIHDIYIEYYDEDIIHDTLNELYEEEIKQHRFWNKSKWDEYAKKNSAFLILDANNPDLMNDIDSEKIKLSSKTSITTKPIYKQKQGIYEISWCIAASATTSWAKKVFPNSNNPKEELWNYIFEICFINDDNPIDTWEELVISSLKKCEILNKYKFKRLHYTNSLGTDLFIGLSDKTIWQGAGEKNLDGRKILVNIPTFEVFTSPDATKTNGVVYSSKPLVYSGSLIDNFMIEFKNGKVVNYSAEVGEEILKGIIENDENSCRLGECALVDYNSPISDSNIIFYTTLYDENASCHLALGDGFINCIENGVNLSLEELNKYGLNKSTTHVDFMIGTSDLKITGIDKDDIERVIFKDGNFVLE